MENSPFNDERLRTAMVNTQLIKRGIQDKKVLQVMRTIPRHLFVPEASRNHAYEDKPLGIGHTQTISQPYMVGIMTQLLEISPDATILEVGTGSGYQAAVLASLCRKVISIERHQALAVQAQATLKSLGFTNVAIRVGDGSLGAPNDAPFDAIIVTASGPELPQTLQHQLKVGGRMVCPVGNRESQDLLIIERKISGYETRKHSQCRFVPLVGEEGWSE